MYPYIGGPVDPSEWGSWGGGSSSTPDPEFYIRHKSTVPGIEHEGRMGVNTLEEISDYFRRHNPPVIPGEIDPDTRYDLSNQNLQGIDFSNANLRHVDFSNCNLRYANFEGADLAGAIMSRTDLTGARIDTEQLDVTKGPPAIGPGGSSITAESVGALRRAGRRLFGNDR